MRFRNIVNDGSSATPRLRMQQSIWALTNLPINAQEWPLAEKLDNAVAAGFSGIEAFCRDDQFADQVAGPIHDRNLPLGMIVPAADVDELLPAIERAHRVRAEYLCAHVTGSLKASPRIADILEEMYEVTNDAGLPLLIETHRGTVTQDLRRTVKVINRFKKIRFMGDFSHYAVAGELKTPWSEDVWDHFSQIARRCSAWHGRISFGLQVQNDIGDGSGELPQQFKKLWTIGMAAWLAKAQPGDILPFTCELGPAAYAITDLQGREVSDRWQQSLVIKRLAEEAWADAQASLPPQEPPHVEVAVAASSADASVS
jgi:sugar phosphate isomerase/epimerase